MPTSKHENVTSIWSIAAAMCLHNKFYPLGILILCTDPENYNDSNEDFFQLHLNDKNDKKRTLKLVKSGDNIHDNASNALDTLKVQHNRKMLEQLGLEIDLGYTLHDVKIRKDIFHRVPLPDNSRRRALFINAWGIPISLLSEKPSVFITAYHLRGSSLVGYDQNEHIIPLTKHAQGWSGNQKIMKIRDLSGSNNLQDRLVFTSLRDTLDVIKTARNTEKQTKLIIDLPEISYLLTLCKFKILGRITWDALYMAAGTFYLIKEQYAINIRTIVEQYCIAHDLYIEKDGFRILGITPHFVTPFQGLLDNCFTSQELASISQEIKSLLLRTTKDKHTSLITIGHILINKLKTGLSEQEWEELATLEETSMQQEEINKRKRFEHRFVLRIIELATQCKNPHLKKAWQDTLVIEGKMTSLTQPNFNPKIAQHASSRLQQTLTGWGDNILEQITLLIQKLMKQCNHQKLVTTWSVFLEKILASGINLSPNNPDFPDPTETASNTLLSNSLKKELIVFTHKIVQFTEDPKLNTLYQNLMNLLNTPLGSNTLLRIGDLFELTDSLVIDAEINEGDNLVCSILPLSQKPTQQNRSHKQRKLHNIQATTELSFNETTKVQCAEDMGKIICNNEEFCYQFGQLLTLYITTHYRLQQNCQEKATFELSHLMDNATTSSFSQNILNITFVDQYIYDEGQTSFDASIAEAKINKAMQSIEKNQSHKLGINQEIPIAWNQSQFQPLLAIYLLTTLSPQELEQESVQQYVSQTLDSIGQLLASLSPPEGKHSPGSSHSKKHANMPQFHSPTTILFKKSSLSNTQSEKKDTEASKSKPNLGLRTS